MTVMKNEQTGVVKPIKKFYISVLLFGWFGSLISGDFKGGGIWAVVYFVAGMIFPPLAGIMMTPPGLAVILVLNLLMSMTTGKRVTDRLTSKGFVMIGNEQPQLS